MNRHLYITFYSRNVLKNGTLEIGFSITTMLLLTLHWTQGTRSQGNYCEGDSMKYTLNVLSIREILST